MTLSLLSQVDEQLQNSQQKRIAFSLIFLSNSVLPRNIQFHLFGFIYFVQFFLVTDVNFNGN